MDRETVIKGLTCCSQHGGDWCAECPYHDVCLDGYGIPLLASDALVLLSEQEKLNEPVKVRHLHNAKVTMHEEVTFTDECGNCGGYLMKTWKACPLCGKQVQWHG